MAFTKDANDEFVDANNIQSFTKGGAVFIIKLYNPKDILLNRVPIKEKVGLVEIIRLKSGNSTNILTSVDIQEIAKIDGKVFEIYGEILGKEHLKVFFLKTFVEELFQSRLKYESVWLCEANIVEKQL